MISGYWFLEGAPIVRSPLTPSCSRSLPIFSSQNPIRTGLLHRTLRISSKRPAQTRSRLSTSGSDPSVHHLLYRSPVSCLLCSHVPRSLVVPDPAATTKTIVSAVEKADVRAIIAKGWSAKGGDDQGKKEDDVKFPDSCYSVSRSR